MVLSIYAVAGSSVFQYIREPVVGSFDIYWSRKLVLSIYERSGWFFQYIR